MPDCSIAPDVTNLMAPELRIWWWLLCTVAIVDVLVWLGVARSLQLRRPRLAHDVYASRQTQLLLSAVYVIVCAFRAVMPRADVQRICLFDSFYSSILVGRSVATLAELCFAVQWALFLWELSETSGDRITRVISLLLVPLILEAETSSWYAVLTTNFLGNALEQSTWLLSGGLIAVAYCRHWPHAHDDLRRFMLATAALIAGFVLFMSTVDVPLYLGRWRADELAGRTYLLWRAGLHDAGHRWIVENAWAPWRHEAAWMTLYFSVGVWVSIALTHAPAARNGSTTPARPSARESAVPSNPGPRPAQFAASLCTAGST
jgi:hypothetical protein